MSLSRPQRSRSETRSLSMQDGEPQQLGRLKTHPKKHENVHGTANSSNGLRRKTSAELISEARLFLADVPDAQGSGSVYNHALSVGGGVRLVNTRRPITPREPGRVLYGNVALAGRPPSAFSLKYLQNEGQRTPKTPSLEPISTNSALRALNENATATQQRSFRRSNSLGSRMELYRAMAVFDGDNNNMLKDINKAERSAVPRKLPALDIPETENAPKNGAGKHRDEKLTTQESLNAYNLLTSRRLVTRNCDILAQSTTQKLVELLKEHAGLKACNDETTNHVHAILSELFGRVRRNEKHCKRGFILGGIYGLVECASPKILLAVAKVVLALHVTGSNLTGACKLIFKVARNEQNDSLFHDNDLLELLIEGLGNASPLDEAEACIYGYGAIRFLTSSLEHEREDAAPFKIWHRNASHGAELERKPATAPQHTNGSANHLLQQEERIQRLWRQNTLVQRLARQGAVQLMVLHLQILNEAGAAQKLCGPPLHALYQLSAALRTLADVRQTSCDMEGQSGDAQQLNKCGPLDEDSLQLHLACTHLVRAAEVSLGELEVQANIVRTLSVLSEDDDCCHALVSSTGRIAMLLGPCCALFGSATDKALAILSRLGYILGNLMAKYEQSRVQFYGNDAAMEYLLQTLSLCCDKPLALQNSLGDTIMDVLVKMIRVIANMSVHEDVGTALGQNKQLGLLLLELLHNVNKMVVHQKPVNLKLQELLHALLGTLHNLCFYQDTCSLTAQDTVGDVPGTLQSVLGALAQALCTSLRTCTVEATKVEVERVLGNLTRSGYARQCFCHAGGMTLIIQHLAINPHNVYDSKACAIGVLVNLLGDVEHRAPFVQLKGDEQLLALLRVVLTKGEWLLAAIVCQAFWNLFTDNAADSATATTTAIAIQCEERILDDLCDLLADNLDETKLQGNDAYTSAWEDFAVVGADLFERIQSSFEGQHQNQYNSLLQNVEDLRLMKQALDDNDEDDVCIDEL